ncbi:MAG TPA: RNA methyltransferase [Thermoanaerobaculia bacterium]|nr:RNA methyltransferase [Thermoanaerobaculia bacterium]
MIHSRDNPRVKHLRRLRHDRRLREERGEALLEGPHLIEAGLRAGLDAFDAYVTPRFAASGHPVLGALLEPPTQVAEAVLHELADADSPRGIVAAARLPAARLEDWRRRAQGDALSDRPLLVVDGLQDPGNLGALARVAEAAGAGLLALAPGTVDWRHPRALRASTGSLLRLPVLSQVPLESLRDALSPARPSWVGLAPHGGEPLWDCRDLAGGPLVLVLGAEGRGLSGGAAALLDVTVTIPMVAPVESINATAAAAVVLFELARRRALR